MTQKRLTQRRTKLEKQKELVLTDLLGGLSQAEVAQKYMVSRPAVSTFVDRHRDSLTALQLEVGRQVTDYAIASSVFRVRELDSLYNKVMTFLAEQGFAERITRYNRDGEVVSQTDRVRDTTIAQIRGILDDAAKELGHRVTKGDTTNIAAVVNIIRGGTPLGMQPIDVSRETIEAEYTVETAEPGESSS